MMLRVSINASASSWTEASCICFLYYPPPPPHVSPTFSKVLSSFMAVLSDFCRWQSLFCAKDIVYLNVRTLHSNELSPKLVSLSKQSEPTIHRCVFRHISLLNEPKSPGLASNVLWNYTDHFWVNMHNIEKCDLEEGKCIFLRNVIIFVETLLINRQNDLLWIRS
jgi:hypothetical protein